MLRKNPIDRVRTAQTTIRMGGFCDRNRPEKSKMTHKIAPVKSTVRTHGANPVGRGHPRSLRRSAAAAHPAAARAAAAAAAAAAARRVEAARDDALAYRRTISRKIERHFHAAGALCGWRWRACYQNRSRRAS